MTPERWEQVKNVLAAALEEPPDSRAAYLDRSCAGDDDLRREVERCLEHERELSPRFLNETALPRAFANALTNEALPWVGRRIGSYQIIELIGVGGMGEVYRAFRADDQYRQDVALKIVRVGHDSSVIVSRFRNERQILASLEHPNIAHLVDGGTTDGGAPYLVMELIEGQPIADYCDSHKLSVSERLALFTEVCAAVQYAHQRLIVHRDIKPSNILVTPEGVPKLLDFGIAKVLGTDLLSQSTETLTAFRALTPAYASPEQIRGEPVTTASDVYSLGVVLYELLTGCSPYAATTGAPQELLRQIDEIEPGKPSTLFGGRSRGGGNGSFTPEQASVARNSSPLKLRKRLKGDLDNIVLMALRKEPSRRYSSVEQFAEDIRRHLGNLPVMAGKVTAGYRVFKFIRRHRAGVTAAIAIAITLILGFAVALYEARIASRRFNDVRSLANSLIFDVHDSIKDLPGSTPAKKIIVDRALQYLNVLASETGGDIGLQRELASAYEKLGSVQGDYLENNLGDQQGTLESYKKALELRKQVDRRSRDSNDHLGLVTAYRYVAHQQWANGDTRAARDTIQHAIALVTDLNKQSPNDLKILYELGFDYSVSGQVGYPGDPQERQKRAEDYKQALATDEVFTRLKPDDIRTIYGYSVDLSELAKLQETYDPQAALASYTKCLELDQRVAALSNETRFRRSVGIDYLTISSVYDDIGDYARAAENSKKDLDVQLEVIRSDPKNALFQRSVAIAYVNTAGADSRAGNISEALDFATKGLEIMRPLISSAPEKGYLRRVYADMLATHGTVLLAARQNSAAMKEFENARSTYQSLSQPNSAAHHANIAACDVKLGETSTAAGQDRAAEAHFRQALDMAGPLITGGTPEIDALYVAADAYTGLGSLSVRKASKATNTADQKQNLTEAQSWFEKSLSTWQRVDHPNHIAPNGFQAGDPAKVKKQIEVAEKALASLH
ncbi:MAG TPA: serine/threonine-protein kinase [Terriglobales bacterium]|nr:serine/threonine-protein kinase [Terriglobales bacterium]